MQTSHHVPAPFIAPVPHGGALNDGTLSPPIMAAYLREAAPLNARCFALRMGVGRGDLGGTTGGIHGRVGKSRLDGRPLGLQPRQRRHRVAGDLAQRGGLHPRLRPVATIIPPGRRVGADGPGALGQQQQVVA